MNLPEMHKIYFERNISLMYKKSIIVIYNFMLSCQEVGFILYQILHIKGIGCLWPEIVSGNNVW